MTKSLAKRAEVEKQDNSIMENNLNWIVNGVDFENRRIEIRGEVGEAMASYVTRNLLKMSEHSSEPIELYISSPGGDAYEGLAIFDAIVACPCDVHIIASGKIMSAGFMIFLAGDKRVAAKHTRFMMHSVSYSADGVAKDHEVQVNEAKAINNAFLDIMASRTKKPRKFWYRKMLTSDYYMNVEEATQVGVINCNILMKDKIKNVRNTVNKKSKSSRR